jgi:transposase
MRSLTNMLWDEWKLVEEQIKKLGLELERISTADAGCTRIRQIPGIGPVVATAIVAAIGNGAAFRKGRDFAAWLGIVPRQYSTGGKAKLLGISKRGIPDIVIVGQPVDPMGEAGLLDHTSSLIRKQP